VIAVYQQMEPQTSLVQRIFSRFVWLVRDSQFEFTEFRASLIALAWGLWLLNPLWSTFASSHSFDAMAHIAPEAAWGGAIAAIGAIQMLAFAGEHRRARIIACALGVFVWAVVAAMFGLANLASTGVPAYSLFVLDNAWALWRLVGRKDG
jgi:hypothetical protein